MGEFYKSSDNTVVLASAGTGKTESLTTLFLHVLLGAGESKDPISANHMVALTFTEKAAAEMKQRIAHALEQLKQGVPDNEALHSVQTLRASLKSKGQHLDPSLVARALQLLPSARITTLHAFCMNILRRYATVAGLAPDFSLLNEVTATAMLDTAIEQTMIEALDADEAIGKELLVELEGMHLSPHRGAVPVLRKLYRDLREAAKDPEGTEYLGYYADAHIDQDFKKNAQLLGCSPSDCENQDLACAFDALLGAHQQLQHSEGLHVSTKKVVGKILEAVQALKERYTHTSIRSEHLFEAATLLAEQCGTGKAKDLEPANEMRAAAIALFLLPQLKQRSQGIHRLLSHIHIRYNALKSEQNSVDFQDLTLYCRKLLLEHQDLREELQRNIATLLVDEFQDTNGPQRDIIYLLRNTEKQISLPLNAKHLQRQGLFIVGDRKQSIYGFRGADVAVFQNVVSDLGNNHAKLYALRTSYRSSPELIAALNALSRAALKKDSEQIFDFDFDEDDEALVSFQGTKTSSNSPALEFFDSREEEEFSAAKEGSWIATRAKQLIEDKESCIDRKSKQLRPINYGDMVLLLPRFSNLSNYIAALQNEELPYRIVRAQGLLSTQEAKDLFSLCKVLLEEHSNLDLFSVLRSPWVLLSDDVLLRLAMQSRQDSRPLSSLNWPYPSDDHDAERKRFERALPLIHRLQGHVERLGLSKCLELLLSELHYDTILAGMPSASDRLRNLDFLLARIREHELEGWDAQKILVNWQWRLARGLDEPAPSFSDSNDQSLCVMTVHQSKGLEFPVVFAADLGRRSAEQSSPLLFDPDPDAGLALGLRAPSGQWLYDEHAKKVRDIHRARERAEAKRLFYVQITRARDRLILSGAPSSFYKTLLNETLPALEQAGLAGRLLPKLSPKQSSHASSSETMLESASLIKQLDDAPQIRPTLLQTAVTTLEDFALCPRRYHARSVLRLPEFPRPLIKEQEQGQSMDPSKRGTRLHEALELIDFGKALQSPTEYSQTVFKEESNAEELQKRLSHFLTSDYAACIARSEQQHRELPFTLKVDATQGSIVLRGQIDLLHGDNKSMDLVDYKAARPKGSSPAERYRFQLDIYRHALRRVLPAHTKLRAGIVFLDGRSSAPVFLEAQHDSDTFEEKLGKLADALLEASTRNNFEGKEESYCKQIDCGFRWLCHAKDNDSEATYLHNGL
ncbi:MAG: UvrD-helicase domain-containing protein [Myxococcales bacterium]|nr:MAG: UvrD-helicase domain-containing protein [Myxococcales bacterium]